MQARALSTAASILALLAITCGPALAEGRPGIWSGFYLGLDAGGGWSTAGRYEGSGFIGGGHIGYNWQAGQMVLGVEADFNASGIEATRSQTIGGIAVSTSHGHDWLASIRARAGVTVSSAMLLYLTAGVAFTNAELAGSATDGITTIGVSSSTSASGWVVGGGAEVKLGGNWSGRLEGLHYGFDESFDFGGTTIRNDEVGVTVIRGGISYHFN